MRNAQWLLVGVLGLGVAACGDTWSGMKKDARDNEPAARQAADDVKEAAGAAVDKGKEAYDHAAPVVDAAKQTAEVKAAFMADSTIDASSIEVDTSADTKTVTLTGTVPTAAVKAQAETIARAKAEGYSVVNNLAVAGEQKGTAAGAPAT
jgi:hyperosmotically inducible protein